MFPFPHLPICSWAHFLAPPFPHSPICSCAHIFMLCFPHLPICSCSNFLAPPFPHLPNYSCAHFFMRPFFHVPFSSWSHFLMFPFTNVPFFLLFPFNHISSGGWGAADLPSSSLIKEKNTFFKRLYLVNEVTTIPKRVQEKAWGGKSSPPPPWVIKGSKSARVL